MKYFFLSVFITSLSLNVFSQQRDLNFYLNQAKTSSPFINKKKNDNKQEALDLKLIEQSLTKPEVNLEANLLLAPILSFDGNKTRLEIASEGATSYAGYDLSATDGGQYQAFISLKQSVFTKAILDLYKNKFEINQQSNTNAIALSVRELEQLVREQYLNCLKEKKQGEIAWDLVEEYRNQLKIMKSLVQGAIYKETDFMLLELEFQNYVLEHQTFNANYESAVSDLNLICGVNDTSFVDIQDLDLTLNQAELSTSKFLFSYTLDSMSLINEQLISELKYRPQVSLFSNAGLNAIYLPDVNRLGFSAGINFSWNIFDGHLDKIQQDKLFVNQQTLAFEKEHLIKQKAIFKQKYLKQIGWIDTRLQLINNQISNYIKLLNVYHLEFAQGEISVMEFKNLLKDMASKKQEGLQLEMEKLRMINSYNYWNY